MLIKRKTQSSDTDDSSIVRTMKTLTLHFPDMCCPVEFGPVEHALAALSSDIRAVPDYSVRRVKINVPDRSPLEKNAILAAVSKTGQSFDIAASSGWSDDLSFDRVRITVPEMDCPVEAGEIERELKKAGITDYQIDIMNRRILTSPAAASGVMAAVRSAGYEGSIDAADTAVDNRVRIAVPEMEGLEKDSVVLLEQLRTLDKRRLENYVCTLDRTEMEKINKAIRRSTGIPKIIEKPLVVSLCRVCAGNFYDVPGHYIRRVNPEQRYKDTCMFCNVRNGYDYYIGRKNK